jgi:hypothetical protein
VEKYIGGRHHPGSDSKTFSSQRTPFEIKSEIRIVHFEFLRVRSETTWRLSGSLQNILKDDLKISGRICCPEISVFHIWYRDRDASLHVPNLDDSVVSEPESTED